MMQRNAFGCEAACGHRHVGGIVDIHAERGERHWVAVALIASAVIAAAAAGASTYMAVQAAEQQAEQNKAIQQQRQAEAEAAAETAAFEERQSRRRAAILLGKQQAIFAAAGIDPTIGSPLLQEIDFVQQAELEALSIRRGGKLAAGALTFEARIAKYRADVAKGVIPLTITSGVLGAASGALSVYTKSQRPKTSAPKTASTDWTVNG